MVTTTEIFKLEELVKRNTPYTLETSWDKYDNITYKVNGYSTSNRFCIEAYIQGFCAGSPY